MDLQSAFEILEIDENASAEEIKQQYRDLASVWHPDRHGQNQRLYNKSVEKMKELNVAYDLISSYLTLKREYEKSETDEQYNKDFIVVACQSCGTKNRLTGDYKNFILKCGKCGQPLFFSADSSQESEERILCGDEECVGTIGYNGRCNYCGKTHTEGRKATITKDKIKEEKYKRDTEEKNKRKRTLKKIYYTAFAVCLGFYLIFNFIIKVNEPKQSPIKSPEIKNRNKPTIPDFIKSPPAGPRIELKPDKPIIDPTVLEQKYLQFSNFDNEHVMILQKMLLTLGYNIGRSDGIFGPMTLTSLIQFSKDFYFLPGNDFPADFLKIIYFHSIIALDHKDWREIYKSNELESWINSQSIEKKQQILSYGIDNTKVIKYLLGLYKFNKYNPKPLSLPRNGILRKNYNEGVAPLTIKTKYKDQHHYIKLSDQTNDEDILTAFIRGGTTLSIDVPLGRYKIKAAVGSTWYGEKFLFGPETAYSVADKIFDFNLVGEKVSGYSVELFLQPHGNLKTAKISPFEF